MRYAYAYITGAFGGLILGWLGDVPSVVWGLCGFIALDIISGLTAAWIEKNISSDVSLRGMARKGLMLLLVAAAALAAAVLPVEVPLCSMVAGAFCVTELISIVENLGRAGVPIPKSFVDALEKLKTK